MTATIAAPLHQLTQKGMSFNWSQECTDAFNLLKQKLMQAPILTIPNFNTAASPFVVYTDASSIGIGAILEQDSHMIVYASRVLTKSEKQYSVIQRECFALVYALKQFRHYLIGRSFTLITDHAPLQWLSVQKMEGLLYCWSLAIQVKSSTARVYKMVMRMLYHDVWKHHQRFLQLLQSFCLTTQWNR